MLADNRWLHRKSISPLPVDYLYLCKGYSGELARILSLFTPSCVVLDTSLSERRRQLLRVECKRQSVPVVLLSESGSVRFSF
jgi:competence protein ComEC